MKSKRHAKILELISNNDIDTQEELLKRLNENGFSVTQATVSRDIKELRLIKTASHDGTYRYTTNNRSQNEDLAFKFHSILCESVQSVDYTGNLVVVKCYTGMANAACAAIDTIEWHGLVGSVAGDDTILLIMRTEQNTHDLVEKLSKMIIK